MSAFQMGYAWESFKNINCYIKNYIIQILNSFIYNFVFFSGIVNILTQITIKNNIP